MKSWDLPFSSAILSLDTDDAHVHVYTLASLLQFNEVDVKNMPAKIIGCIKSKLAQSSQQSKK